jgi:signal transduction histidine kinase
VALRPVLACGAALPLLWGLVLPHYLLLDDLAIGPARWGGLLGALAAVGATLGARAVRRRLAGPHGPHHSAWDLAMLSTVAALAVWVQTSSGGRLPYLEGFALALLDVAAGWGAALGAYVIIARNRRRAPIASESGGPAPAHPPMRSVFVYTALGLALVAAIVLGVGSVGRAAGARAQQIIQQSTALAELAAAVLDQLPADDEARRGQVLATLITHGEVAASIHAADARPESLEEAAATPGALLASTPTGWLCQTPRGRYHYVSRPLADGRRVWVRADIQATSAVLAPDDAPGLMLLALLVLAAPLATGIVGRELTMDLGELTTALQRAADRGADVAAVLVRSNDEIGDLARAINETLRAREAENARLARELEGADATDRARSRFLAGASHELRTPLNAITGYCHLLQQSTLNEAQREDVALIESAGHQLLGHVDEILDISRIEAGEDAPLERRPTDLEVLVRQVAQARAKDVPAGLQFEVRVSGPLPRLSVDPLRIRQTLENLVGNALKFTRTGRVQIHVGPADGGVHIQVVDTGPGIPADELETIFLEFHRVEGQRQVAGTGLGLAIARRFVQQHGGVLRVESVLGQGSTFHLVLPPDADAPRPGVDG